MTNYENWIETLKKTAGNVGNTVEKAANSAAKKTGELAELAKINVNLYNLRNEQEKELAAVGALVYEASKGSELDEERLAAMYASLDARKEKIEVLEKKAGEVKNAKTCKACGKSFSKEYAYCPICGEKAE